MICSYCGKENKEIAKYCRFCGKIISRAKHSTHRDVVNNSDASMSQSYDQDRRPLSKSDHFGALIDPRDGKSYKTIKVGNQIWMAENLAFKSISIGKVWINDYNDEEYYETFGYYYDWIAACHNCPPGWHLPSDAEWSVLINQLGGYNMAGGKMKETGNNNWAAPNKGANNESRFSALPAGNCEDLDGNALLNNNGFSCHFWSSDEIDNFWAKAYSLFHDDQRIFSDESSKENGFSVRCIKDNESSNAHQIINPLSSVLTEIRIGYALIFLMIFLHVINRYPIITSLLLVFLGGLILKRTKSYSNAEKHKKHAINHGYIFIFIGIAYLLYFLLDLLF